VKLISRSSAAKALSLAAVSALVLSGCAAAPEEDGTAAGAGDFLACAVSDRGGWNDKSFNESTLDGMERAEQELGVEISLLGSEDVDDIKPNLEAMVEQDCDVIVSVGFNGAAPVNEVAAANPGINFLTLDGFNGGDLANLKPLNYAMEESSYLVGYAAASISKTGTVGTFGGEQFDSVTPFMSGFYFGAMAYGKDSGKTIKVLGWDPATQTGDFAGDGAGAGFATNNAGSKTIALSQAQAGADFIYPVGGDQFGAVSEAFKELGIDGLSAGVDKDIALTSPEYASFIVTSAEKRMTVAVFEIIEALVKGEAFSAEAYIGTLANEGTAISPFYDFESRISDEVKTRLAELQAGIIDESIDPLS
jgi:basic membrane protein A